MLLVVVYCATSSAAVWSELLSHEGAHRLRIRRDHRLFASRLYDAQNQLDRRLFLVTRLR